MLLIFDYFAGIHSKTAHLITSALVGAFWAVICLFIPKSFSGFEKLFSFAVIDFIMVGIVELGNARYRKLIKEKKFIYFIKRTISGTFTLVFSAVALGGMMELFLTRAGENTFIYRVLSDGQLWLFITFSLILLMFIFKGLSQLRMEKIFEANIEVIVGDKTFYLDAMIDSGNCLKDPYDLRSVVVVDRERMAYLLDDIDNLQKLKYHLIPFRTVGGDDQMMEIITADYLHIYLGKNKKHELLEKNVAIGLSKCALSEDNRYSALLPVSMCEN